MQPWQLGAAEAAELIRKKELSPVELTDSCLERIDSLDGELRAWVTVDADGARLAASALQGRIAAGDLPGRLAGVTVGVKDVIDVAGLPTTASSRVLAAAGPAQQDASCIARLRQTEVSILGKLHTAEFACADPPPTQNPWNAAHTPGGSSSGSGVAVATGMVAAALGTQTGGSTLRPASYNGVVGLKPSYGMISNRGVIPVAWSLDHVGIIARSVTDAAMVLGGLAGHDPLDLSSSPRADEYLAPESAGDKAPVIGLIRPFFLERCEPDVLRHTLDVAGRLEAFGARVREIDLPASFGALVASASLILRTEMYTYHRTQFAECRDLYGPLNTATLDTGSRTTAAEYVLAMRQRPGLVADLEQSLAGVDIALTPGTPAPAPGTRARQAMPRSRARGHARAFRRSPCLLELTNGVSLLAFSWSVTGGTTPHCCAMRCGASASSASRDIRLAGCRHRGDLSLWRHHLVHGRSLLWGDFPNPIRRRIPQDRNRHAPVRGPRRWAIGSGTCAVIAGYG